MVEVVLFWKFDRPLLVDNTVRESIKDFVSKFDTELFSVSDFLGRRIYTSAFGYTVVGEAMLKVRLYNHVGPILKSLAGFTLQGSRPILVEVFRPEPSQEGYLVLEENFGELDVEQVVEDSLKKYFEIYEKHFGLEQTSQSLIPVFRKVEENLYRVDLFGSDSMIELWNVLGFELYEFYSFFYHPVDLPILKEICKKLRRRKD